MKTRFDYSGVWITGVGEAVPVGNMETPHLLNTVRMLVQKPARTLSILVADIEHATFSDTVWTPFNADDRKQSLKHVPSLSDAELVEYHTAQDSWTPDAAPSLFAKVLIPDPDVIPEWEQPDSTNPYKKGDRVRFNGKVYESLIDNNVWSPSAYPAGWREVSA